MKYSLHIGINYEGTKFALNGCLNDAADLEAKFKKLGYNTFRLLESEATKLGIIQTIETIKKLLKKGDTFFLSFSGHGTQIDDLANEETDGMDEAICPYDCRTNLITDDELRAMLKTPANVIFFADCCHSGTLNKAFGSEIDIFARPRSVPFSEIGFRGKLFKPSKKVSNTFLCISGCVEASVSYDAMIDGRYNGALTANALSVFTEGVSVENWYKAIKTKLPNKRYPQIPQLIGKFSIKTVTL
jgi:metacaspase-1